MNTVKEILIMFIVLFFLNRWNDINCYCPKSLNWRNKKKNPLITFEQKILQQLLFFILSRSILYPLLTIVGGFRSSYWCSSHPHLLIYKLKFTFFIELFNLHTCSVVQKLQTNQKWFHYFPGSTWCLPILSGLYEQE